MVPLSVSYSWVWCAIGHHTMKSGARYGAAFSRKTMADFRRCAFEHHNRLCGVQFSTTQPKVARISTPLVESIQQLIIMLILFIPVSEKTLNHFISYVIYIFLFFFILLLRSVKEKYLFVV